MNQIARLRSLLGLSQSDFAELLNINKGNFAMIETGKRSLNSDSAILLSKLEEKLNGFEVTSDEETLNLREDQLKYA